MKSFAALLRALVLLSSLLSSVSRAADDDGAQLVPTSPRLTRLAREHFQNPQALTAFWAEMESKAPLVESSDDVNTSLVTFLWRGSNDTTHVAVLGGMPAANLLKPLTHLPGTDVWYLTETHSNEARFQYVFQLNGPDAVRMEWRAIMTSVGRYPPKRDPLNPRQFAGWSYVELPAAPPQPWIERHPDVPAGKLTKEKFKSDVLKAEYPLSIYIPPSANQTAEPAWLMIALDGGFKPMETILDNLLAAEKTPPIVVVGVGNLSDQSRQHDLECSDEFLRMLVEEVVPWARKTFHVYSDANHTIITGRSLGGKMSAYCGLKASGVFGKILSQSGSFLTAQREETPMPLWHAEPAGMLAREFAGTAKLPLEFYLEVGRYETTLPFSHLLETRRLRDVLEAKGYRVHYSEFVGGHNEVCWRGSFADGLIALTDAAAQKTAAAPDTTRAERATR